MKKPIATALVASALTVSSLSLAETDPEPSPSPSSDAGAPTPSDAPLLPPGSTSTTAPAPGTTGNATATNAANPTFASAPAPAPSAEPAKKAEPFAFGDFSWLQGSNRQRESVLDSKYFTGSITVDANYNYSFHRPIDHTNAGSTATFRSQELNISYIEVGGDFHHPDGPRARLMLQYGTRATGVPRNDNTPLRGQFDLYTALRFVTEGYAGYHWNKLHGINFDVGIFKSYVGLLSYNNFENWNYQPSFTSDNTPWFFTGARVQIFPSDKLKIEPWIINGWQTYGMFNELPGFGAQIEWRPEEYLRVVFNNYVGWDTANNTSRTRFHSDDSILVRYFDKKDDSAFVNRGALSLTADLGFESGGGVTPFGGDGGPAQNFVSAMLYHRLWLFQNQLGWTVGGGFLHNPGRYLALLPPGAGVLTQNPGDEFDAWDVSTNLQYMPTQFNTFGIELVHRVASAPYFSGRGGLTSPNGWNAPIGDPTGYTADLQKQETRIILSHIFRM